MVVFKVLLIILISAPVIGLALYFYSQMLAFIREKDRIEDEQIARELAEAGTGERKRKRKKSSSAKGSRNSKNSKNSRNEQSE